MIAEVNQPGVLEVNSPLLDLQRAHMVPNGVNTSRIFPQRVLLMDLAQKLRVDADFRGAVSPSEIPGQLRGSAIGVAPYPETVSAHHYFSPLQVYEYLAAGLPIVASSIGQIPHAVGDAGVLVPGSNASALAQALVNQSRGMSGWRRHIGNRGHRERHMRGTAS